MTNIHYPEWTDGHTEQLREAIAQGHSYRVIGLAMGRKIDDIAYRVKKHELKAARIQTINRNGREWTPLELDELRRLNALNVSYSKIGRAIGRDSTTVRHKANDLGLQNPYRNWWVMQRELAEQGMKKCSKCERVLALHKFKAIPSGNYAAWCKECDNAHGLERKSKDVNSLLAERLRTAREHARHLNLPVEITLFHLLDVWERQEGRCYYTGVELTIAPNGGKRAGSTRVSIDRLDSDKGYIQGNVVLCCDTANMMKNTMSVTELKEWCRLVVAHAPE